LGERRHFGCATSCSSTKLSGSSAEIKIGDQIRITIVVTIAAGLVWFRLSRFVSHFRLIGIIVVFSGGYPIFFEAFRDVRAARMTMESSMTIALLAARSIGKFFTALEIMLVVLIWEVLEGLTTSRGRTAIADVLQLLPRSALRVRDEVIEELPISEIRPSNRILVQPGAQIPVDGMIESGCGVVDEASITGEATPVQNKPGLKVCMRAQQTKLARRTCGWNAWALIRRSAASFRRRSCRA
jgi:cation transport ATPase